MPNRRVLTSESVSDGHPDKIADQISDAILDAILIQDKNARVACNVLVSHDLIVIAGEITTTAKYDLKEIAYKTIAATGHTQQSYGSDFRKIKFIEEIQKQSLDIAQGVNKANEEIGAGDQGIMYGYACDETKEYMPMPIVLAHKLLIRHKELRESHDFLKPDAKSQVSLVYEDDKPIFIDNIVLSTQHDLNYPMDKLKEFVINEIIKQIIPVNLLSLDTKFFINPTGKFVQGGPAADTGLTGRKIVIDSYGGIAPNGGGAFSGKDPTKVDRSASYMARYIAKNIVAAGIAGKCTVHLSYAIAGTEPTSIDLDFHSTGKVSEEKVKVLVQELFDLSPLGMINQLNLKRPIYHKTAAFGHFGRDDTDFSWEKTDMVEKLKRLI